MIKAILIFFIFSSCLIMTASADVNGTDSVLPAHTELPLMNDSQNVSLSHDPVSEMVSFVKEAVAYAKATPREEALAEFSDRNGSFFRGNLYIYAYDFDGVTIAHPLQTELIGKSRLMEEDAAGGLFIKKLRDTAVNNTGFVVFYYVNPAHNNTIEKKLGYVEKVDDTWWLGSGIYGENVTLPNLTL